MALSKRALNVATTGSLCCGAVLNEVYSPASEEDLNELSEYAHGKPTVIIGGLSNILALNGEGIFVRSDKFTGKTLEGETLIASSGETMISLALFCEQNGLSGMEKLCGIRGTIGGAVFGNSGCYGEEISQKIAFVRVYSFDTGRLRDIKANELSFTYRKSSLRRDIDMVIGVGLTLKKEERTLIRKNMAYYKAQRLAKQPTLPSLGSVFKQVDGVSAGYYIEKVGLKGFAYKGMAISEKHANFIVNTGEGKAEEYLYLMNLAKNRVYESFGKELKSEVRIVGGEKD